MRPMRPNTVSTQEDGPFRTGAVGNTMAAVIARRAPAREDARGGVAEPATRRLGAEGVRDFLRVVSI